MLFRVDGIHIKRMLLLYSTQLVYKSDVGDLILKQRLGKKKDISHF
jgi:hypothetical protein